jgi:hypothetical protein
MDMFLALDSLEVLSAKLKKDIAKEKDGVTSGLLKASLDRAERAIVQVPCQNYLNLDKILVEQFHSEGAMGTVWRVSF